MDSNFRSISLDNTTVETTTIIEGAPTNNNNNNNNTDTDTNMTLINNEPIVDIETIQYKPLEYHWFYTGYLAEKLIWIPMSYKDSKNLEKIYTKNQEQIKLIRKKSNIERCEFLKDKKLNLTVTIKGGRFEVDLIESIKRPIYWNEKNRSEVRRCLWFYKENNEQRFLPYDEEYSEFLEIEYEKVIKTNTFHKRIDYNRSTIINQPGLVSSSSQDDTSAATSGNLSEEAFVFHSTTIMLHFTQANELDEFGNLNSDAKRPRIVKRGLIDVVDKVEPDEIENIDHLCFVVHGIGDGCDLRFRPIVECVDDFRDIGAYIIQSHFKSHVDSLQINGRVEFLPISWHHELHGDPTGVDNRLKPITLPSIPKLRQYSNTTILDVLFYTSPIYCQTIVSKVGNELNRLTQIFLERNPYFSGKISLVGHSLGSLILFDLLSHQFQNDNTENLLNEPNLMPTNNKFTEITESLEDFLKRLNLYEYKKLFDNEKITAKNLPLLEEADLEKIGIPLGPRRVLLNELKHSKFKKEQEEVEKKIKSNLETLKRHELGQKNLIELNAMNLAQKNSADYFKYGLAGTGQLVVKYPQLNFKVSQFFALGSPIAMFLTVRGIDKLGTDFKFPTCPEFFNVFHPFDPVAYRFEPLICTDPVLKPILMPHHKGRKRMHLELRENLTKVSEDLKQRMYGQINKAWSSLAEFAKLPKVLTPNTSNTSNNSSAEQQQQIISNNSEIISDIMDTNNKIIDETTNNNEQEVIDETKVKVDMGKVNQGRRIDYVLQERPIEMFNEYLFALASHACYWESEDTLLLIIKEVYGLSNTIDAHTELQLLNNEPYASNWLVQNASTISSNVQKTLSYFSLSLPQSITNVLPTTGTSILYSTNTTTKTTSTTKTENNNNNQ